MKKLSLILTLVICFALSTPSIVFSAAPDTNQQRVRHKADFFFYLKDNQIAVSTTEISFDTGLKKVNKHEFDDKKYLPKPANGDVVGDGWNSLVHGTVVNTPTGLKAYALLTQVSEQTRKSVHTIYEFDYTTSQIRKVMETKPQRSESVQMNASLGIYYTFSENRDNQYYSLIDNKPVLTNGHIIEPLDVTSTNYSLSPHPAAKDYGIYCPTAQPTKCNMIQFGGKIGAPIKVTRNDEVYDNKTQITTKTFYAGSTKVKFQRSSKAETLQWKVTGTRNGKTRVLYNGPINDIELAVSPGNKYLVLVAEGGKGFTVTSSTVHIYDLKTLNLVRKYNSPYKGMTIDIIWASDDLFTIDYSFSSPSKYPPIFHYIPYNLNVQTIYDEYSRWDKDHHWDSFSYDDMFHILLPVAIKSGDAALQYEGQPSFYMNGRYYVPLEEFTKAFHIKYVKGKDQITFTRNNRNAALPMKSSGIIETKDGDFLPLGEWNKSLGLTVSIADKFWENHEVTLVDQEAKTGYGMK